MEPRYSDPNVSIFRGDSRFLSEYLSPNSIDLTVTSPPYYDLRECYWEDYAMYMSDMLIVLKHLFSVTKPGRHVCYVVQPWVPGKDSEGLRVHYPLEADLTVAAYSLGFELEAPLVWEKTNSTSQRMFGSYPYPPTTIYTPTSERILVFRKPGKVDTTNKDDKSLISYEEWDEWTKTTWYLPFVYNKQHSSTFNIEIPRRLIRLHSFVDDLVLDPFGGIFTTGLAALETGRNFLGIELLEEYCQIGIERLRGVV